LARREAVVVAAPATERTYLRFSDGEFSGCNLFLFRRPAAVGVVDLWQRLEGDRKKPLRLLRGLGVSYALRYAMGRLRLNDAMARLEQLSGARVGIVELADGRAAIDVDKPSDLQLVRLLAGAPPN
jgi:hypothetical protein